MTVKNITIANSPQNIYFTSLHLKCPQTDVNPYPIISTSVGIRYVALYPVPTPAICRGIYTKDTISTNNHNQYCSLYIKIPRIKAPMYATDIIESIHEIYDVGSPPGKNTSIEPNAVIIIIIEDNIVIVFLESRCFGTMLFSPLEALCQFQNIYMCNAGVIDIVIIPKAYRPFM
jgi:hypothetical protein